ncbi:hypothetical protein [Kitasatospora sp. NPDC059571]|uniref:hypothetical protein n=1 Tax=Kitasatospora sp. NPDC059571 TaxID=3346871 RepID=UPI003685A011
MKTSEDPIAKRFKRETAEHQLTILREDGLYRHLRMANPQYGGVYSFDVLTWPNGLLIRGDGPNFVFSSHPTADLFEMFRGSSRHGINPGYWREKVRAGQVKAWSEERFRAWLTAKVATDGPSNPGLADAVNEQILENGYHSLEYEDGARTAVAWFDHDDYDLEFPAKWERDFDDWSWEYLWACHAIVRGIAEYDRVRAEQPVTGQAASWDDPAALDASAYRYLADGIGATMADPNEWDGDDAEEAILLRYVKHLADGRARVLAACDAAERQSTRWENPLPVPEWVATVRTAAALAGSEGAR